MRWCGMILAAPAAMTLIVLLIIRLLSKVGGYILCFFFLLMGVAPFVYDFYAGILKDGAFGRALGLVWFRGLIDSSLSVVAVALCF